MNERKGSAPFAWRPGILPGQPPCGRLTYGEASSFLRRPYARDLRGVDVAVMGCSF